MITRYTDTRIADIWSLASRYALWQRTELAVIKAREQLDRIPRGTFDKIEAILKYSPIDATFIDQREKVLNHDLNAFLEERMRFLSPDLAAHFHAGMTSYDTEESAFVEMLSESATRVLGDTDALLEILRQQALAYRFTPMNARTHGQEAEMQSFGKRCLTWFTDLRQAHLALQRVIEDSLCYSKLSGAIGTHSGIDAELERAALSILGLRPWAGATQIMPRATYSPLAGALADLACVLDKIATDVRLGSRSGRPLWHEPFGKKQKGSSAMPHKKNNIDCENTAGMARMAACYADGIRKNIVTWEERAIEQSSVERVFWPDLFHVTLRAIKNMTKVLKGLAVYPDNMLLEIVESRGTYASNAAKEFLTAQGATAGISREDAYRIVQLACFNAFEPSECATKLRAERPQSLTGSDAALHCFERSTLDAQPSSLILRSIEQIIQDSRLRPHPELAATEEDVRAWNEKLATLFVNGETLSAWGTLFRPKAILANEAVLFKEVFDLPE